MPLLVKTDCLLQKLRIFVLIILSVNELLKNAVDAVEFIGAARNLTVIAFEDQNYHDNVETGQIYKEGLVKLNISWLPPQTSRKPDSYSIVVTTLQQDFTKSLIDCPDGTLYYTTENKDQLRVDLPEDPVIYGVPELNIVPGCVYGIQVFANPRRNPNINHPNVEYRVPDCVGKKCSCAGVEKSLPELKVDVEELQNNEIFIKWTPTADNNNIISYTVSYGVPTLVSRGGFPVYDAVEIAQVPANNNSFVWTNGSTKLDGIVYVAAKDSNGCNGPQGSYLVRPIKNNNQYTRMVVIFIISAIVSVSMLATASMFWTRNRKKYIIRPNINNKDYHSPVLLSGRPTLDQLLLTKRNALYVEQEIEEAIHKGEADMMEISYARINFKKEIGKGHFGKVYLASIEGFASSLVAVKMNNFTTSCNDAVSRNHLLDEIAIMKNAGHHPHLVQLLACCTLPSNPVCAILEYLEGGDLLAYLHDIRSRLTSSLTSLPNDSISACSPRPSVTETLYTTLGSEPPATPTIEEFTETKQADEQAKTHDYVNTLLSSSPPYYNMSQKQGRVRADSMGLESDEFLRFAIQIARGMQHLETRSITHRDLAARNILLDSNMNLKVSDFGLSRNGIYVIAENERARRLPVRWMSPEAMRDREFSPKSDVWSYAVVLWEIGTLGAFPYPDIRDDQLLRHVVLENKRLTKPAAISDKLYSMMQACWAERPSDRPNFSKLLTHLLTLEGASYFPYGKSNPCYTALLPTEEELEDDVPGSPNIFNS
ncbi:vascular endothelial growth factor receptor 2-like [Athalia rosae]|uniref:vascular endothelial growth factor receptor 2-like n=1 Tax=Athalia rosae TaxID=37344 RepID=UPI0020347977|nr:vascular endothelial growth factor receptor 2-like [Athalia rosae]